MNTRQNQTFIPEKIQATGSGKVKNKFSQINNGSIL